MISQTTDWEKVFNIIHLHIFDKRLDSRIHKEFQTTQLTKVNYPNKKCKIHEQKLKRKINRQYA
jgi:hypothetical protein